MHLGRATVCRLAWLGARLPLAVLTFALAVAGPPDTPAQAVFDLADVSAKAEKLAQEQFQEPKNQVPDWLLKLTYDQWRTIRFRPEHALWKDRGLKFQVQFFHPGLYYNRIVTVNVVDAEGIRALKFSPSQFDYADNDFASRVPQDLGYAGFRLHYPINAPKYDDEVIVFLGASYFRAVGKDQVFGISARGLAIDTALPSGEEFPYFKEFWLVRPAPGAKDMAVYALLDSPSMTGAYRFGVYPGTQTVVNVEARLYRRKEVKKLGLAPLTSMFFFGENTPHCFDDFRPEVHDSDGLLLSFASDEWLWRPLDNPETLRVDGFAMHNPRGFGLLQRDRDFEHYQDLETHMERRPSLWITPRGDWGDGRLELVEIPTKADTNDNVVAFWVPGRLPELGKPVELSYSMSWYGDDSSRPPGGRVVATRRDHGTVEGAYRFVLDFEGKRLKAVPADTVLRAVVTVASKDGEIVDQHVVKNPQTGGWRLTFQVRPKTDQPVELRAFLQKGEEALTETWSYLLNP